MQRCPWFNSVSFVLITVAQLAYGEPPSTEQQRSYADFAAAHKGKMEAGQRVFEGEKAQCSNCHRITGLEKSGPNLDGIGAKYTRAQLVTHILDPSRAIMPGYEQATVTLKKGTTISGRIERATKLEVRIIDASGKQSNLKRSDIEELSYRPGSLMPDNLTSLVTKESFADLIAYLESLNVSSRNGFGYAGKQIEIPDLSKPIEFELIHPEAERFESPVWVGPLPGTKRDLIVLEHQEAKAWRLYGDRYERRALFVDLANEIHISPNQGLMCIAFHPNYERNGRYFLEYEIKEDGQVKTLVVERSASQDRLTDSGSSSRRLLEVAQPAFNHNGGCIAFGADGMLYAAFGDGGPQRDPEGYSQDLSELKGAMIRIDVDGPHSPGLAYRVPADNPFVDSKNARPEIWAYGLREPWRFSFDPETGDLWLGDVGQDKFEEVAIIRRGENHGWNVREAFAEFSSEFEREDTKYIDPIFAYEHGLGFSVTGGHVYRADPSSSFYGVYFFGDYNTRSIWGLRQKGRVLQDVRGLGKAPGGIASFGLDHDGQILLVTYEGQIFRLQLDGTRYE